MNNNINDNKAAFLEIFDEHIKREGAGELRNYLERSDFFTAPASTKYHCAFEGGLCLHSILTYKRLLTNIQHEYKENWEQKYSHETIAVCGLLHDLCKIEYYRQDFKNVKIDGEWLQQPYYLYEEKLPYGHGEKSVYIINGFIRLTREEALAINWHMGGFDCRVKGGSFSISEAFAKYPLTLFLHIADLQSTYVDEKRGNK